MSVAVNTDQSEVGKFEALAHQYWDSAGPLHTLHALNPLRAGFVAARVPLAGALVADVGCGGGLLAEALARHGGLVTAIDLSPTMIEVAKLHAAATSLSIDYRLQSAEALAVESAGRYAVVCCMELAEHVPDPGALVATLARLLQPGGSLFVATINRTPRAFLGAIVAAEYLFRWVPRGTHEYARLVRPSELARSARVAGLSLREIAGVTYEPWSRRARLSARTDINYIAHFAAPSAPT